MRIRTPRPRKLQTFAASRVDGLEVLASSLFRVSGAGFRFSGLAKYPQEVPLRGVGKHLSCLEILTAPEELESRFPVTVTAYTSFLAIAIPQNALYDWNQYLQMGRKGC